MEQEHQQQQKIDFTEYEKWVKSLQPELEEQINDMTKIVPGFDKAHLNAIYASEYKLYDKMVELNILQTNGKLTAEFKIYLQILLQDASKNSENIMDKILSPGNSGNVATFAEFLGLSNEEFSDICSSENRKVRAE